MEKDVQCNIARDCGLCVPYDEVVGKSDKLKWDFFPCITKPIKSAIGAGKQDICIVNSRDELDETLLNIEAETIQLQEYIEKEFEFQLMAHAYSKLYNIPSTGLRFFTVYGPAGRPDMAYFGFTNKLLAGDTIQIFNYGNCKRDFTYVDDIVEGVKRVMQCAPEKVNGEDGLPIPPYRVYNIGNNSPENLLDFVDILQQELIRAGVLPEDYDFEAHKKLVPMQPGDVPVTYADTSALERDFGFKPSTSLREGLRRFAEWYKEFYL